MPAKFCLSCGARLEKRDIDGTERLACPECSFVHWGNYSVGVGALVVRDGKFLLVRRNQEPGKGVWTNPGGYIEQFEPIEETVVKELYEETSIVGKVRSIVAVRDLPREIHNVYIAFEVEYISGEPKPDMFEVDQAGFYSLEEMESMNVAAFTRWLIDVALHGKTGGLTIDREPLVPLKDHGLFRV
jgi:ADP-ribose pyrophosphatase YjhB (NUDIX family)